jgi:hypothetical protein
LVISFFASENGSRRIGVSKCMTKINVCTIERTAGQALLKDIEAKSLDTSPVDVLLFASVRGVNRCALLTVCPKLSSPDRSCRTREYSSRAARRRA